MTCHGSPSFTVFEPTGFKDVCEPFSASGTIIPAHRPFDRGSRALFNRRVPFPKVETRLWLSTIQINGVSYVSGIRLVLEDQREPLLGYHGGGHEEMATWGNDLSSATSVAGFLVAINNRGVRGLSVLSTSGAQSNWVGDHCGLPKRRLMASTISETSLPEERYLKGGFDVRDHYESHCLMQVLTVGPGSQTLVPLFRQIRGAVVGERCRGSERLKSLGMAPC